MTSDRFIRALRSPEMLLFTLILGTTLPLADTTSMNVGRFFIARGLDSTPDETRWLTAGYSLFVALGVPLSWRLRGLLREESLYILATVVFMAGSVVSMLSHFMPMMMVGRALQGLSGGVLIPLSISLINETFPPDRRGRALALLAVGNALAVSLGPTLGGLLVDTVGWRWTMGIHLPVGFLTILLASLALENHPRPEKIPFDLSGWLLFSATGFFTMYTLMEGERFGWHSALIEGTGLLTLGLFFSYLLHAARHPRPILPLELLRYGGYILLTGANFLRSTAIFGRLYLLPLYLEIYYHFQSHQAGIVVFVGAITELLIPVFGVFLLPRNEAFTWSFMAAGSLLIGLSNLAYLSLPVGAYVPKLVLYPQMLFGLGVALTQVSLAPLVARTLPSSLHRVGMVAQLVVQFLGGMFGTIWARHLLNNMRPLFRQELLPAPQSLHSTLPPEVTRVAGAFSYNLDFFLLGGVALAGSLVILGLPALEKLNAPESQKTASTPS
ncbi:MAG: MFS transporter [Leptospirillia bacterium]